MKTPGDDSEPRSIFDGTLRTSSVGILVLITLIAFEAMAVAAALPTAARDLHGVGSYGWAFTGFLVANVVGMVASGVRSDRSGPRLPLVAGLGGFVAGLVLAGTASAMPQLVAGRVVQGLSGGLIITAIYVLIGEVYPERLRPQLFAAISSAWVVPSLVGPLVSGALSQHASWRWVFLGLVPFVLLGGLLVVPAVRGLPPVRRRPATDGRQRLVRALAVAFGVAALEEAGQHPSWPLLALAAAGTAALVWGLVVLLPPGTAKARPGVSAPVALRALLAGAFFGTESLIPLSLSTQHGYGAVAAGLPLAVSGLSWAAGSWWQGRPGADAPGARVVLIRAGFGFLAAGIAGMALTALPSAPAALAYPSWLLAGLGAGLTMSSVSVLLLRYTTDARRGADAAALQLADATAAALTTGIGGVLVAAATRGAIGHTTAFVTVDVLMVAIALLGVPAAGRARAPAPHGGPAAGQPPRPAAPARPVRPAN